MELDTGTKWRESTPKLCCDEDTRGYTQLGRPGAEPGTWGSTFDSWGPVDFGSLPAPLIKLDVLQMLTSGHQRVL